MQIILAKIRFNQTLAHNHYYIESLWPTSYFLLRHARSEHTDYTASFSTVDT